MAEKVTEKQKLENRAVEQVEKLVGKGVGLTSARNKVGEKFGFGYAKMVELTKHLSPKKYPTEEE